MHLNLAIHMRQNAVCLSMKRVEHTVSGKNIRQARTQSTYVHYVHRAFSTYERVRLQRLLLKMAEIRHADHGLCSTVHQFVAPTLR